MPPELVILSSVGILFGSGGAAWVGTRVALNGLSKRVDAVAERQVRMEDKQDTMAERLVRVETKLSP